MPPVDFPTLAAKSLSVICPSIAHYTAGPRELPKRADVFRWARERVLTTVIAGRYPLADVARAHEDLSSRALARNPSHRHRR